MTRFFSNDRFGIKTKGNKKCEKDVGYDLMTDLGLYLPVWNNLQKRTNHVPTTPFRPMQQELVNLQCSDDNHLHENIIAEYVIEALRK